MKDLEQQTLNSFLKVAGKKTITEYSEISGIERTRFFRLIHGAEMKVKEFVSLQSYIRAESGAGVNWERVLEDLSLKNNAGTRLEGASDGLLLFERTRRLETIINNASEVA